LEGLAGNFHPLQGRALAGDIAAPCGLTHVIDRRLTGRASDRRHAAAGGPSMACNTDNARFIEREDRNFL
jgi:hypothetical protein